ncbi:MAG: RtcB family protein [Desulfobacterales bacterium]|nr:RtcB family protein [Desulfobacterales bacterium]
MFSPTFEAKKLMPKQKTLPIFIWSNHTPEVAIQEQAVKLSLHPAAVNRVCLMADMQYGPAGMPVGGVVALENAVCPGMVGVDINCGMAYLELGQKTSSISTRQYWDIMGEIERTVPMGAGRAHTNSSTKNTDWILSNAYRAVAGGSVHDSRAGITALSQIFTWATSEFLTKIAPDQLGTLGGGNHFIDLVESQETGCLGILVHTGSRRLGYDIGTYYTNLAKELCDTWRVPLSDPNFAFLPTSTKEGQDYIRDMEFASAYANENRRLIIVACLDAVRLVLGEHVCPDDLVTCAHNFARLENHFGRNVWIHRKGATSAADGELAIVPGSMGDSSFIVRGKGSENSFKSCSHGAGRIIPPAQACLMLTKEVCDAAMNGIIFKGWPTIKKDRGKLKKGMLNFGEAPQAYRPIKKVIAAQADLIEPLVELKPVAVMMGD